LHEDERILRLPRRDLPLGAICVRTQLKSNKGGPAGPSSAPSIEVSVFRFIETSAWAMYAHWRDEASENSRFYEDRTAGWQR